MRRFDVLILGAGIVGCACALECVRAGMRVGIVERCLPGSETTAAGMGHIVVMDDSPAQLALSTYSRSLWADLLPQLPSEVEYERRGTIWIAADEEEMNEVHAKSKSLGVAGVRTELLDESALAEAEPNLRPGLCGGLLVPDDAVIYPPAAADFFLKEAVRGGAELLCGHAAHQIAKGVVTLENGDVYAADWIVVATGVSRGLMPRLPIEKRKGHLLITDRYPGFLHHQLVELGYLKSAHKLTSDSVAFNIQPRCTGQLLIGSSRQYGNDDAAIDAKVLRAMLDRATSYMPQLANLYCIRAWTGFRAATPDKLPLIGPTSDSSVFVAAGFEGLGITNAPGAGRLLVDALLGRDSVLDRAPFLPARFDELESRRA